MTAVEKFLFHTNFDEPPAPTTPIEPEEELPPPPSFSEEELEAARQQALAMGQAQGRDEALRGRRAKLRRRLGEPLGTARPARTSDRRAAPDDLFRWLAHRSDRRAQALSGTRPARRASARSKRWSGIACSGFTRSLGSSCGSAKACSIASRSEIDRVAAQSGFEGRLVLLSEPDFQPSDVKVEWADGGAERNTARTWTEIESRLQHCIKPSQRPDSVNPTPEDRAPVETEGNPQ